MLERAGDKIVRTIKIRNAILNLGYVAKYLQSIIGVDNEVHFFISTLSDDSATSELFKIVSKLFLNALRSDTIGANVSSQALRDVFQLARIPSRTNFVEESKHLLLRELASPYLIDFRRTLGKA